MDGKQCANGKVRDVVFGLVCIPFEVRTRIEKYETAALNVCFVRMPSEAIPMQVGKGSGPNRIYLEGGSLVVDLHRRCDLI